MYLEQTHSESHSDIMSKYILDKYKDNIEYVIQHMHIYPEDYLNPKTIGDRWFVQYRPKPGTNVRPKQFSAYEKNGSKIQINRTKDHRLKIKAIEYLRDLLEHELRKDPAAILKIVYGPENAKEYYPDVFGISESEKQEKISIKDAFEECYKYKSDQDLSNSYMSDLKSFKNRFLVFLGNDKNSPTHLISKKMCFDFLKLETKGLSSRTFNNLKILLSTYLTYMYNNEYIKENFAKKIPNRQTKSEKNRPFTKAQLKKLWELVHDDFEMKFYLMHAYLAIMRSQTISRLRCKNIDLDEGIYRTDTKTGKHPKPITNDIKKIYESLDLSTNPDAFIFGRHGLVEDWNAKDKYRRSTHGRRFAVYKRQLGIPDDELKYYTIHSLRHNGIRHLHHVFYLKYMSKGRENAFDLASEDIKPYSGHQTIKEVEIYLKWIDPDLQDDYGEYIKSSDASPFK